MVNQSRSTTWVQVDDPAEIGVSVQAENAAATVVFIDSVCEVSLSTACWRRLRDLADDALAVLDPSGPAARPA